MTVEEYFEEWWTPKELPENGFNKTAMLDFAEMYHKQVLSIHDVRLSLIAYEEAKHSFLPPKYRKETATNIVNHVLGNL